jgi:integrase
LPKITKSFVEKEIKSEGCFRDTELKGFCVRARKVSDGSLSKTYIVHSKVRGTSKLVTVTIGRHGVITAENARIEAIKILSDMARGENPNVTLQDKQEDLRKEDARRKTMSELSARTLSDLLQEYLATRSLKENTATDYERLVTRCLKDWLDVPIVEITRDMVQSKHIAMSKEHPAQANYTMRILRALFAYAIAVYEDDQGKPLLTQNPVDRLRQARLWNRVQRRQRVIRPAQLQGWYEAVCKVRADARDLLLLELFTGLRQNEAMSLQWKNVDFKHDTILIEDTKNHTSHMIPMCSFLRAIIEERKHISGDGKYVFPGRIKGHITDIRDSIKFVVQESGVEFSEHDLRRTFETTAESLDVSYYTLKRLLNHKTGNDPTAGYIVTSAERMREASQKIGNFLADKMGMPEPNPSGKVVNIHKPKKTKKPS